MLSETLIKYCSLFFHKIDKVNIRIFLESSPQYPNLLSVVQTLQYANIDVQAGQCDWDYLRNLKSPFLLHVKIKSSETLIISKWDAKCNCLKVLNPKNNKWEIKSKEDIGAIWAGVVIYTNADIVNSGYSKDTIVSFSVGIILVSIATIVCTQSDMSLICSLPIAFGLIVSICTYWQKNISKINFIEKICHKSSVTDCDAVENSSYSSWRGLSMSDMALSFFSSQLICVMLSVVLEISNALYTIYFIAAIVSVPITFYSVYSQIRIKKICPLCLMILASVLIETLLFIYMPKQPARLGLLVIWGIINILILCLLYFYSYIYLNRQKHLETEIQLLKLKRKNEVILLESSHVNLNLTPMWLGKEQSPINITTIISPSCKHCRKVVLELLSLIDKGIEFRWNIILGKIMEADSEKIEIWIKKYIADKNRFLYDLHLWSNGKIQNLFYSPNFVPQNEEVSNMHRIFDEQMTSLNIIGFPQIVLNDRILSTIYTAKDLEYIITDLSH